MWKEPPADYVHTRTDYDMYDRDNDGNIIANRGPITVRGWSDDAFIIGRYNAGPTIWCKAHGWEPMSKYPYPEA